MTKIRALRQFSHYHAGNFSQGEERPVPDHTAEALIGLKLAERVELPEPPAPAKRGRKHGDD